MTGPDPRAIGRRFGWLAALAAAPLLILLVAAAWQAPTSALAIGLALTVLVLAFALHRLWREVIDPAARLVSDLRDAHALTDAIVDVALEAIVTADEDGRIVSFNPAAERIFGLSAAEARGRSIGDVMVPDHMRGAHDNGMARMKATSVPHVLGRRLELEAKNANGDVFPVEVQLQALSYGGGKFFAAYIRDLRDMKARERELAEQRERLHQAEKMTAMGSLLAGVAHELNNPLAVVIAQSTLLEETAESPSAKSRAEKIHAAADRCGRIIKSFLAMARQQAPVRTMVGLPQVVRAATDVTGYGLRTAGIVVETRLPPGLPPVEGDADQLAQVVSNLLINAQQAMIDQPGDRRIVIEAVAENGRVRLSVGDNGPGVPPELRERIFEPYFTTKPAGVGTGIGLAVCRNIVTAHKGRLTLADGESGGARFDIDLPAGAPAAAAAEGTRTAGPAAGLRILVVDDEPDVGATLAEMLQMMGAETHLVQSRTAALDVLTQHAFDVVMSDLRMPGGGGAELWSELLDRSPTLVDRFVFVTGDTVSGPAMLPRRRDGSAALVLEKPFTRADVVHALGRATGGHNGHQTL